MPTHAHFFLLQHSFLNPPGRVSSSGSQRDSLPCQSLSMNHPVSRRWPRAAWKQEIPSMLPAALAKRSVPYRAWLRSTLANGPENRMVLLAKSPQKVPPHRSNESCLPAFRVGILRRNRERWRPVQRFAKSTAPSISSSRGFRLTPPGPVRVRLPRTVPPDGRGLAMRIGR